MPHDSVLNVLAEIAITVVGFSMLASVFRGPSTMLRFLSFRNVAEIGMISAFGALAPQLFQAFGFSELASWRWGSGSFGLLLLLGLVFGLRRMRSLPKPKPRPLIVAGRICVPVVFGLAGANAFFPSELSGGRHILAIIVLLVIASTMFLTVAFDMDLGPSTTNQSDQSDPKSTDN